MAECKVINIEDLKENNQRLCLSALRAFGKCFLCPYYENCESRVVNKEYENLMRKKRRLLNELKLLNNEIENMKKKVIMKINGHEVIEADLRPLGSKHDKMCINCGITGLRELKKRKCGE